MKALQPLWTMPRTKKRDSCPYCRGTGFEQVEQKIPELYGEKASSVTFAVPCRKCKGLSENYVEKNKERLELPYCFGISAFNPSIYKKDGKIINFMNEYNFILKYIENYKEIGDDVDIKGLYIHSKTAGNGKTLLASCICFEMYSRHHLFPIYIPESNLLDRLQANVADAQISPREQFQKAPILFIDDMWRKNTGRDWVNDELFTIIDYRYTHKLPTIITSNVSLNSKDIDARLASRLNTMCAPIAIPDVEIRTKEQQKKRKELFELLTKGKGEENAE